MSAPSLAATPRSPPRPRASTLGTTVRALGWAVVVGLAVHFVAKYALRYLRPGGARTVHSVAERTLLRVHIVSGLSALFGGLAQFWTGLRRTRPAAHRWLGRA
jgi:hypothetical protein